MVEVRRAVLVLTFGCNEVYGLDPTTVRDLEPPACSTVVFGVPMQLDEFRDGNEEYDAQLSADGSELWLVLSTPIGGGENRNLLHRATRGADGRYSAPVVMDLAGSNERDNTDPALTADGLRLMFRVDDTPGVLYEGIRASADQFPFETVVPVLGISTEDVVTFDLTWDGLRIYVTDSDGVLSMGTRPSRDKPFGGFVQRGTNMQYPTVSGDELEIFYRRWDDPADPAPADLRLYRSERASRDAVFGNEQVVLDNASDPDIAPTSSQLIVSIDSGLAIMKRRCD